MKVCEPLFRGFLGVKVMTTCVLYGPERYVDASSRSSDAAFSHDIYLRLRVCDEELVRFPGLVGIVPYESGRGLSCIFS